MSAGTEMARDGVDCIFCEIVAGRATASVVYSDALTLAFLDVRQFHNGHVLIIPREHVLDIRHADDETAAAVMMTAARVARAVTHVFPCDGISMWHSAGPGAHQEVPHLHIHVHPRVIGDDVLRVYPSAPTLPPREGLDAWAGALRTAVAREP